MHKRRLTKIAIVNEMHPGAFARRRRAGLDGPQRSRRLVTCAFWMSVFVSATASGSGGSSANCVCDLTDGRTTFTLACGEQHCVGAHGYFCEAEQQVRQAQCMMLPPTPDAAPQPAPKYQGRVDVEIRPAYNQGGRWYFEVSGGFVTDDDCERTKVAGCAVTVCAYPLSRSTFATPGKMSVGPTLVGGNYSWTPGSAWSSARFRRIRLVGRYRRLRFRCFRLGQTILILSRKSLAWIRAKPVQVSFW